MSADMTPSDRPAPGPRRPWLLIAAALLLALLSVILWAKWWESRARADKLQAEIKQAYAEAEALRTQAAQAEQRAEQLERELKDLSARQAVVGDRKPSTKTKSGAR